MNEGIFVPCAPFLYLVPDSGSSSGAVGVGPPRTGPHGTARDRIGPHMEVSRRVSPAPFHYLITEQAKSLVALQELQHEVGALLEFRELVMDTFPHLRHKLCGGDASPGSRSSPGDSPGSPGQRRDWEPGVRVRRKLSPKGSKDKGVQPKSGDTLSAGSAVQDSGFSTETSCKEQSKEAIVPSTATATAQSAPNQYDEAEDELWNLLDVIQRKGTRLRDEVEVLQEKLQDLKDVDGGEALASMDVEGAIDIDGVPTAFKPGGSMRGGGSFTDKIFDGDQLREVKFERDYLLDKMSEMEAETLAARVRAETLARDVSALAGAKRELEEQLRTAVLQKGELNSRIHDLHIRFVGSATGKKIAAPSAVRPSTNTNVRANIGPSSFAPLPSSAFAQVPQTLKQPTSMTKSPEPTAKQTLIRSNTFDVVRSASPALGKQSAVRSDTFKMSDRRTLRVSALHSPTRSAAESIEESRSLLISLDETRFSVPSQSKSISESIKKTHSQATTLDASLKESGTRSRSITQSPPSSKLMKPVETRSIKQSPTLLQVRLGQLDGVVSQPSKLPRGMKPELDKMAAVLKETSVVELQRHLLVTCVENQRLASQDSQLRGQINRLADENDELSFRLAEREIELESARAQIRILDRGAESASPRRRPSKIPKSYSAPKPPAATANPSVTQSANQSVSSQFANQQSNHSTSNQSAINQSVPNNQAVRATNESNRSVPRTSLSERSNPHPSLTERTIPRPVQETPRTVHATINRTASRTSLNNSLTSSIPSLTRTITSSRNGSSERIPKPTPKTTNVPTKTNPVSSNRTATVATRTLSNPSLTNRSIQPPSNRSIISQSNRSLSSNSLNKKKSLETVRRGSGGGKRDVSIGYRKEGRRREGKEEGAPVVTEKRDDSVPWAHDSSSEYFDSINESGSLLMASEPPHWLAGQREAMAECDSLELELAESNQWEQSH